MVSHKIVQTNHRNGSAKRIALLSWESMHSIAVGGLAAHVSELAAALCARGHDVHLFTRMGPGQGRYDCIEGVHYHRCPFDPHADFLTYVSRMCDSFVRRLREVEGYLHKPFDVIHGHDWLSTEAVVRAKNELGHSTVFTVHSTEYGRCGNELWEGQSRTVRHLEWEATYVADRVICVSNALRDEVHWLYQVPKDKLVAIHNGVNARKFDADINVASVRRRHDIGVDDPMILFAGRLAWQKGPDLLVDAIPRIVREHPRTKFVFVGEGDMRPGLEQRVSALGMGSATRFLGYRNGLELISMFKSADAVCVPSRNEPFGIVILEAWSARKPVIVTRNGGPAEFVRHQDTGVTVTDDTDSITWGLGSVLGSMEQARQMGLKGRQEVETRFSWDTIAGHTEAVYDTVVEARGDHQSSAPLAIQEIEAMARRSTGTSRKTRTTAARSTATVKSTKKKAVARKVTPKKKAVARKTAPKRVTDEMIRQRAHEIYLSRNGQPGDPVVDWLQAERELLG